MYHTRAATAADVGALQAIYASCVQEANWLSAQDQANPDFAMASRGEVVFVATADDGEVLGLVSVWTMETFIHHLYVAPRHRRAGVGRALLASLSAWLSPPWQLKCVRANRAASDFYHALGWSEVRSTHADAALYAVLEWQPASDH